MNNRQIRCALATGVVLLGLLVLVSVHLSQYIRRQSPQCDDGNACTMDFLTGSTHTFHCENWPHVADTPCTTSCFVPDATSGVCGPNAGGHSCPNQPQCQLRDYTECAGYCVPFNSSDSAHPLEETSPDCETAIPLKWPHGWWDILYNNMLMRDLLCLANQCVGFVAQVTTVENLDPPYTDSPVTPLLGTFLRCEDFLNTTTGVDVGCIQTSFVDVHNDIIYYSLMEGTQIRLCVYKYSCGQFNATRLSHDVLSGANVAAAAASSQTLRAISQSDAGLVDTYIKTILSKRVAAA